MSGIYDIIHIARCELHHYNRPVLVTLGGFLLFGNIIAYQNIPYIWI
nr:MAG TPA: hypothetical protein [Caudoviricetes sp.]